MIDLAAILLSTSLQLVELQRPRISERVTVVSSAPSIAMPSAVTVLGSEELAMTASVTLDDALRSVPGFSLFRRSSSRVANPTTQGVTLRGLAASGSSRALVLADDVPLNDPVGGWVYWNRLPAVALQDVAVARGAAGDLHGADALAGVVTLRSVQDPGARLLAEGGSDGTARVSAFGGRTRRDVALFGAAEGFTTDGFVITAPESRGPIDTPASSRHGSAHGALRFPASSARVTLRASRFGESRGNGTPVQRNSTRVTQISGDATGGRWSARGYALTQRYEQTFSAVSGGRTSERQTSAQDVTASALGGAADWAWTDGLRALSFSGSGRRVDAELSETAFSVAGTPLSPRLTAPRQTTAAVSVQASARRSRSSFGAGLRAELWRSEFEERNRHVFMSPRLWAVYGPSDELTLRFAFQSGYRGPTINELYRPFRVGSVITDANPLLRPESARGVEAGTSWHRRGVTVRALGFWTRVSDAIVNVTLSSSGASIVRQRQNAARIRAAGAELEVEVRTWRSLVLTGSSSFTDSVFAAGPLDGRRVPQVPRVQHSLGARGTFGALRLSSEWRYIGHQFDDDLNAFTLDRSLAGDARAGWIVKRGVELFAAMENVLDDEQDVGRTPLRTIGLPRTTRAGLRLMF
jgi:outer membrane receptor protein involved in Fe transport